jgi:sec-independent protein translocase protein TatB
MFDIGWQELLVIAIVAIVVVGPKELPAMMRVAGQWMGRARRMARDFQLSLEEIGREAELEALRRDIDNMKRPVDPYRIGGAPDAVNSTTEEQKAPPSSQS